MRTLFVTASAAGSVSLSVDLEYVRVRASLQNINKTWSDQLRLSPATQLAQLGSELIDYKPAIVHFSGHCESDGSLILVDAIGEPCAAAPEAVARLLLAASGTIRMVVLNACYSAELARLLREKIQVVIGFETAISDSAALAFSPMFYRALAAPDVTLQQAIEHGRAGMDAEGGHESDCLRVSTAPGTDPAALVFVPAMARDRTSAPDDELSKRSLEWARRINPAVIRPLVVPVDMLLHDREQLPMWDFAALLLKHSVTLSKTAEGDLLRVDLRNQTHGIYNNDGKKFLHARFLGTPKQVESAREFGRRIRHLQRGATIRSMDLADSSPLPVLRWASGGYLPLVRWRGRRWVMLFFRDIRPIGWNIANGASETRNEWRRIDGLASREASEEIVILEHEPEPAEPVGVYRLEFGAAWTPAVSNAEGLLRTHHDLRKAHDRVRLVPRSDLAIVVHDIHGRGVVEVVDNGMLFKTAGVHVSVNTLELGIEVTRVGEFDLPDDACVVDGETFLDVFKAPIEYEPKPRLVRRPVGLFDLEYLRRVWKESGGLGEETAEDGRCLPAPQPGDMVIFDYDIRRRRELVMSDPVGYYEEGKWLKNWGEIFSRRPTESRELRTFCPASWKVIESMFDGGKI